MTKSIRGWTRQPSMAEIIEHAITRFKTVYPWSAREPAPLTASRLHFLLLTAAEVLALDPLIPTAMHPEEGHNDGPSWHECAKLAREYADLLFAGFYMPPARADEGIDLDAVYVPVPDDGEAIATLAVTRPNGTCCPPDEDGIEVIDGRSYRRLWWD